MCLLEEFNNYKDILLGKFSEECNNNNKKKSDSQTVTVLNPQFRGASKTLKKDIKTWYKTQRKKCFPLFLLGATGQLVSLIVTMVTWVLGLS